VHTCILEEFTRLGGGQVYAQQLANALRELGHEVEFIVAGKPRVSIEYPMRIINVSFRASYDPYSLLINYISHAKLKNQINKYVENCDLVINNHPNFIPYAKGPIVLHGLSFVDFIIDEHGNIKTNHYSQYYQDYIGSTTGHSWSTTQNIQ
jgi:hypothetical protein